MSKAEVQRVPGRNGAPRWRVNGRAVHRLRDRKLWLRHQHNGPLFVLQKRVADVFISTVGEWWIGPFSKKHPLGYDYSDGMADLWYESMVWVNGEIDTMRRYRTEEEARTGHDELIAQYRHQGWAAHRDVLLDRLFGEPEEKGR